VKLSNERQMHKAQHSLFALLLAMMVILPLVAATENQVSLKELGYNSFELKETEKKACTEFLFSIPDPGKEFFPIISIKAAFLPKKEGKASVSLYLNNAFLKSFNASDFKCARGECWARTETDRELIKKENTLKVCASTGRSITGITISNDSLIGYYKKPRFRKKDFRKCIMLENNKCVESYNASTGEDLNITIFLTNTGTALSTVDFNNRVREAGTRPSRKEIGQTSFSGIIYPNQTKTISYTIRVKKAVPMSLPPAIAVYKNAFGETETLSSNSIFIYPKQGAELTSTIGIEAINQEKKEAILSFTIFNKEKAPIKKIKAFLEPSTGLEILNGNSKIELGELGARQAYTQKITVRAISQGSYSIGCTYSAKDVPEKKCEKARLSFKEENPVLVIGAIVVLSAIAVVIYFYIATREEYKA